MMRSITFARSILLLLISVVALSTGSIQGQTSATDGTTPASLAPGAPAGSYSLSDFEHINLFNGNLSASFQLVHVGGRGNAQYSMMLPVERHWRSINGAYDPFHDGNVIYYSAPETNWWDGITPGYGPGVVQSRTVADQPGNCNPELYGGGSFNSVVMTRLTFSSPDASEHELVDTQTNGAPHFFGICGNESFSRGKVFVAKDGSGLTFIADQNITENNTTWGIDTPSGVLKFPDGTQYRVDGGLVTSLRDRNGNKLTFTYGTDPVNALTYQRLISVTDSLNRVVTVSYADNQTTFYDSISFKGFGGASRTIRVHYASLGQSLRAGYALANLATLFPEYFHTNLDPNLFNPTVVSSIELPDGRSYQFQYNNYGELARIVLPTGGALEYDHTPTSGVYCYNGQECTMSEIYRRTVARRTYPDGASSVPESVTSYATNMGGVGSDVTVDRLNAAGTLLEREQHFFFGTGMPTSLVPIYWSSWKEGKEYQTDSFSVVNGTAAAVLRRQALEWRQRDVVTWCSNPILGCTADSAPSNDPRMVETISTMLETNQVSKSSSINPQTLAVGYDQFNNPTDSWLYDWGAGAPGGLLKHTHTDYLTVNPVNGVDYSNRTVVTSPHILNLPTRVSVYDASENELARTTFEYDKYSGTDHAALQTYPRAGFSELPISGMDPAYNSTTISTRGNPTGTSRYILVNNAVTRTITTSSQFDIAGNVVKVIDPRNTVQTPIVTVFDFGDRFGSPDGNARLNSGSTELNTPGNYAYALPTSVTNAVGHTVYSQFDYYLGQPVDSEDANTIVSSVYYNDGLDRPTKAIRAVNGGADVKTQTIYDYQDASHKIVIYKDQTAFNDQVLHSESSYDGLGRTTDTRLYEGANYILVQKQYDALGRAFKTSNPYRPQSEVAIWTTNTYDSVGRVTKVTTPDSAVINTDYNGNETTVTDQHDPAVAGHSRKTVTDGLGRLKQVIEDPTTGGLNYLTTYNYDALDDLITVTQGGQTRSFVYDSLKRLLSVTNPESGNVCYGTRVSGVCQADGYDDDGDLLHRTDARGVVTNHTYDSLNRMLTTSYANDPNNTPSITNSYDPNITNGKGRLSSVTSTVSTYNYTVFDALGRVKTASQVIGTQTYTMTYSYDLTGAVTLMTYPSGHSVTYSYDTAARLLTFSGTLGGTTQRNYSTGMAYSPFGGMTQEKLETTTPVYNKRFYNARGQLAEIREGLTANDSSWQRGAIINSYSTCVGICGGNNSTTPMVDNNGNLKTQQVFVPLFDDPNDQRYDSFSQTYQYDSINRLQSVAEGSWQQTYGYDQYGNRKITSGTTASGINNTSSAVDQNTTTNRLYGLNETEASHPLINYDASGNQTKDYYTDSALGKKYDRTYDGENKIKTATTTFADNSTQLTVYSYDGSGHRVKRNIGGTETWQIYGVGGEVVAEYAQNAPNTTPQKEYGYRGGQLLIAATVATGWGAAPVIHDNPLVVASTTLQARHITELRDAINALRSHFNLPAYSWQQPAATGGAINIGDLAKADPILEMRTALDQALGAPANGYAAGLAQNQLIKAVHIQELRDRVLNAWVAGSSIDLRWLVDDHLGTPRMILDQTGSLAGVSRHDYLPFGEELGSLTGRTTDKGYTNLDSLRQRFSEKERDGETTLDYFGARYYASNQGRFTSPDPLTSSASVFGPQSWNRYSYGLNNPLRYVDPSGMESDEPSNVHWITDGYGNYQALDAQQWQAYMHDTYGDLYGGWYPIATGTIIGHLTYVKGSDEFYWKNNGLVGSTVRLGADGNFESVTDSAYGEQLGQAMQPYVPALMTTMHYGMFVIGAFSGPVGEVSEFTSLGLETGEGGSATVSFFRLSTGPHFTVETEAGGTTLETEQVIVDSQMNTTVRVASQTEQAAAKVDIALPDAQAAMQKQLELMGKPGGPYNVRTNSCVTHCMDILRAGGLDTPTTTSGGIKFLKSLGLME